MSLVVNHVKKTEYKQPTAPLHSVFPSCLLNNSARFIAIEKWCVSFSSSQKPLTLVGCIWQFKPHPPKPRLFEFFNSVTYPYPCKTLVLDSIRVSPWVFPFLGFLEPYFVSLTDYTHAIQMTEVLLLLLRQHHLRALFYWFSDRALVQEPTSFQSYAAMQWEQNRRH